MSAMLPARAKKIDMTKLTDEEQKLFRLYGKIPTHKNVLQKMQKARFPLSELVRRHVANERKYFDSGDYALSKAGKTPQENVGTAIPQPENPQCDLLASRMRPRRRRGN
ncbi:hypothetical protein Clacol_009964 [Clathrus columnatus]|uniref:mRNA stability protein n=1 Tax=Clathrus columnatus TaxID=1419009 RepID=A0AAV5ASD2_9AGAM|nr:hypothetical protein Clacol_009964 [Clathrus columnatus]